MKYVLLIACGLFLNRLKSPIYKIYELGYGDEEKK